MKSSRHPASSHPDLDIYADLRRRLGEQAFRQRCELQLRLSNRPFIESFHHAHFENIDSFMRMVRFSLQVTGFYRQGYRNFLDLQVVERVIRLEKLPLAFNNFRCLHISDLHIDIDPILIELLLKKINPLQYDLVVVTGDFRFLTFGPYQKTLDSTARLIKALKAPSYGILGNHDFIEFVPVLEEAGMRMLLNETVAIEKQGEVIYLSGVDDPHFYETDDLERTRTTIPDGGISILLAHSPGIYRAAAASGYDVMFSGHTHAGQICWPGGRPLITHGNCPSKMARGAWKYGQMQGFTSSGVGASGVAARFNCPPEITIHELKCA